METTAPSSYRDISKPFAFTGNTREYFSIWVVNILLTILTLGIYSAWAKVRTKQYFYGNTILDGHAFRYTASPLQILKGRLIAVALFAVYYFSGLLSPLAAGITIMVLMLLLPAFVVMSTSFQLRNTAYRNIRFNFDKDYRRSYFLFSLPVILIGGYIALAGMLQPQTIQADGQIDPAMAVTLGILPLLIMLGYPWWEYLLVQFKITHADFGTADAGFEATPAGYYGMYIKAGLLFTLFFVAAALLIPAISIGAGAASGQAPAGPSSTQSTMQSIIVLFIALAMFTLYCWVFAYIQTRRTNLVYNNITIDGHRTRSRLEVGTMLYLYITNTIAMVISLGLLIPWAKIRTARYRAGRTSVQPAGDFDSFIGAQADQQSAFGEEMGEVFDMDLGF